MRHLHHLFGENQGSALFAPGLTGAYLFTGDPGTDAVVLMASEIKNPVIAFIADATIADS